MMVDIDINEITSVLKNTLLELNITDFTINIYKAYTNIIINGGDNRRIIIYDDTICIVYGKSIFRNDKYDIIDWLIDRNELVPLVTALVKKRFGKCDTDNNFYKNQFRLFQNQQLKSYRKPFCESYFDLAWGWGKGHDWHLWFRIIYVIYGKKRYFDLIRGPKIDPCYDLRNMQTTVSSSNRRHLDLIKGPKIESVIDSKGIQITADVEKITRMVEKILIDLNINGFEIHKPSENHSYVVIDKLRNDKVITIDNKEIFIQYNAYLFGRYYTPDYINAEHIKNENELENELCKIIKTRFANYMVVK
jgi:hypothetical protein